MITLHSRGMMSLMITSIYMGDVPMITLHSYGFRSFSLKLNHPNSPEVEYVVQYNNQNLPWRIWKKNYRIAESTLDDMIKKTIAGHTVRSLIKQWVKRIEAVSCHSPIEGGTTALFIYGGA